MSNNRELHAWLTARLSCFVVSDEKLDKNEEGDRVIDQSTWSTNVIIFLENSFHWIKSLYFNAFLLHLNLTLGRVNEGRRKSIGFLFVCCPTLLASKVCSHKHVIASVFVGLSRVQSEFAILWFLGWRQAIDVIPKWCKRIAVLLKSK